LAKFIDRRQPILCGLRNQQCAMAVEERISYTDGAQSPIWAFSKLMPIDIFVPFAA
jgi:hypothetical protein